MIFIPTEILLHIAGLSEHTWRAMLAVPDFAAWTLSSAARAFVLRRFCETAHDGTKLRGEYHSFFGIPSRKISQREYIITCWTKNGKLHRDDGPAMIALLGENKTEEWYCRGVMHRDGGPALVRSCGGEAKLETWYRRGVIHREDGPAETEINDKCARETWKINGKRNSVHGGPSEITYYKNRAVKRYIYHVDDELHRDNDLPAEIDFSKCGKIDVAIWSTNGKTSRRGGPAEIYFTDGIKTLECWYLRGFPYCENGPSSIYWYKNGNKKKEIWSSGDRISRYDTRFPAVVHFYSDGRKKQEIWYARTGGKHRDDDKPARIKYDTNGAVLEEIWYNESLKSRGDDLPARIVWNSNGEKEREEWYCDGKKHRDGDEPAVIFYNLGKITCREWYFKGSFKSRRTSTKVWEKEDLDRAYPLSKTIYDKDLYLTEKHRFIVFGVKISF